MTLARINPLTRPEDELLNNLGFQLGIPPHKLSPYTRLLEDLLLDQQDQQLLIASLERQFNLFLTEEQTEHVDCVGDLQRLFTRQAA
ncbi:MAG: hypothetical protein AAF741_05830 [Bacteroidota bacterium]